MGAHCFNLQVLMNGAIPHSSNDVQYVYVRSKLYVRLKSPNINGKWEKKEQYPTVYTVINIPKCTGQGHFPLYRGTSAIKSERLI